MADAIQFIVTKEIPCKYGIHKETNSLEISQFLGRITRVLTIPNGTAEGELAIPIETPNCILMAYLNDYIVKDADGNLSVCPPDAFKP